MTEDPSCLRKHLTLTTGREPFHRLARRRHGRRPIKSITKGEVYEYFSFTDAPDVLERRGGPGPDRVLAAAGLGGSGCDRDPPLGGWWSKEYLELCQLNSDRRRIIPPQLDLNRGRRTDRDCGS